MLLPNFEKASVDLEKLTAYALNASHPEGRHKARVFLSALGVTAADGEAGQYDPGRACQVRGRFAEHYELGADLSCRYGGCSRATVREGTNGLAMHGRSG